MATCEVNFFTIYMGLTAGFSAVAFVFQSRHHNLYEHEMSILNKIDKLEKQQDDITEQLANKLDDAENKIKTEEYINSLKKELRWASWRYNFALIAFILLMIQIFILLFYMTKFVEGDTTIQTTFQNSNASYIFWFGAFAFTSHIFGDLFLAFINQQIIRDRLKI